MSQVVDFLTSGTLVGSIISGNKQSKLAAQQAAAQKQAQQVQQRSLYASQEDQAQLASEQDASGRRLRGIGRQALAFQGNTLGVLPDLTAGAAPVAGAT